MKITVETRVKADLGTVWGLQQSRGHQTMECCSG